jgi:hypothetical protein
MTDFQPLIRKLQRTPVAKLTGAIKTYPLHDLHELSQHLQHEMRRKELAPQQAAQVENAFTRVHAVIAKRAETVQQLIAKFSQTTPEVIALHNSVFTLVPSRDLLEDSRAAFAESPDQLAELTRASANILEAVNIEIQQRFYELAPETIAIHYSEQVLGSYLDLLKNLLPHIQVNSDIARVYKIIIHNLVEGIKIAQTLISPVSELCHQAFQTTPPMYDAAFNKYTTEELDAHEKALRATLAILERDITGRPSIIEFTDQCRQTLHALTDHAADRKTRMRKTTRVLQLAHYIEFLNTEHIAENATSSLMLCQTLFEDTQRFLWTQQTHLDVTLNLKSLEEAHQKVEDGLRYRQHALGQLFKEISQFTPTDFALVPEKRLGDITLLLQEVQGLIEDFLRRSPAPQPQSILKLADDFRVTLKKLHEALLGSHRVLGELSLHFQELEQMLPNLSKFYDEELIALIRKALKPNSVMTEAEAQAGLENAYVIPLDRLEKYLTTFIKLSTPQKLMLGYLDFIQ